MSAGANEGRTHACLSWSRQFAIAVLLAASAGTVRGQTGPGEHSAHHPPAGVPGAAGAMTPRGATGPGGMESMMEGMGVPPPKELYPEMMRLEAISPEQRGELISRAQARRAQGSQRLATGLEGIDQAIRIGDSSALSEALGETRAGLDELESGLATSKALEAGEEPRAVALSWFREQLRIGPADGVPPRGLFGLGWFHAFAMVLLTLFAVVMIAMYFHKMRRAAALLAALTGGAGSAPPVAVPAASTDAAAGSQSPKAPPSKPAASASAFDTLRKTGSCGRCKDPCSVRVRVARVFAETREVKTFRLAPVDDGPLPFDYLPGQFLNVILPADGARPQKTKRSYTIASSPTQAAYCEITLKREPDGVVSRYLHDSVHEGSEIRISAPYGRFTFTGDEAKSIVLIGGGVGVTPLMSVVRYLTDRAWPGEIVLFFCFRTPADFIFREELEHLARRHPNLRVVATVSQPAGTNWGGRTGRLSADLVREIVPDIAQRLVHLCGPKAMMESTRAFLLEFGVARERIRFESFGPATPPAAPRKLDAATAATLPTVRFARSEKSAPLPPDQTVLDAAESVGVEIEWSCRSGTCGSCIVKLLSGEVSMEVQEGLDDEDRAAGMILACQARATANIAVEA